MPQGNDWDMYDSTNTMTAANAPGKLPQQVARKPMQNGGATGPNKLMPKPTTAPQPIQ